MEPALSRLATINGNERKNAMSIVQQKKAYKGWAMEGLIAHW
jgi:hypothetical protein